MFCLEFWAFGFCLWGGVLFCWGRLACCWRKKMWIREFVNSVAFIFAAKQE